MKLGASLGNLMSDIVAEARQKAEQARSTLRGDHSKVMHLMRPNVEVGPAAVRRLIQPIVAVAALSVLLALVGVGGVSLFMFLLAGAMVYAILTKVFGIELAVTLPPMSW